MKYLGTFDDVDGLWLALEMVDNIISSVCVS
jgi:hypothetical protein